MKGVEGWGSNQETKEVVSLSLQFHSLDLNEPISLKMWVTLHVLQRETTSKTSYLLDDKDLMKWGLLRKERICSKSKFFFKESTPTYKELKNERVTAPANAPIHLEVYRYTSMEEYTDLKVFVLFLILKYKFVVKESSKLFSFITALIGG